MIYFLVTESRKKTAKRGKKWLKRKKYIKKKEQELKLVIKLSSLLPQTLGEGKGRALEIKLKRTGLQFFQKCFPSWQTLHVDYVSGVCLFSTWILLDFNVMFV